MLLKRKQGFSHQFLFFSAIFVAQMVLLQVVTHLPRQLQYFVNVFIADIKVLKSKALSLVHYYQSEGLWNQFEATCSSVL